MRCCSALPGVFLVTVLSRVISTTAGLGQRKACAQPKFVYGRTPKLRQGVFDY